MTPTLLQSTAVALAVSLWAAPWVALAQSGGSEAAGASTSASDDRTTRQSGANSTGAGANDTPTPMPVPDALSRSGTSIVPPDNRITPGAQPQSPHGSMGTSGDVHRSGGGAGTTPTR